MKISQDRFFTVGNALKIPQEQLASFWSELDKNDETTPFSKYLFYFGSLIIMASMTWLMNVGWEIFGGGGLFLMALAYALIFFIAGASLWNKKGMRIPAGLFTTIAVTMVPLAIYGLETYFEMWPQESDYPDFYTTIKGQWIYMEIGTILIGLITLTFFPFAFTLVPILIAGWFLTMDIVPYFAGPDTDWKQKYWILVFYGLFLIVLGFLFDRKNRYDFGFWTYLFGTLSFFIGVNCLVWDKGEGILLLYLVISLFMMILSIILDRQVLMVFGAFGFFGYLSHLAYEVFKDSPLFPFILSFIGLLIIYLGILYQRNLPTLKSKLRSFLN